MKKVLVFMADGTEEVELVTVVDYLRRANIEVDTVSVMDKKLIKGAHEIEIMADYLLEEINHKSYDAAYAPGGLPGAFHIRDNKKAIEIYQAMAKDGKIVAALCAAPTVLDQAGLLEGKDYICFPGFEDNIKTGNLVDENVVVADNVITGRGPALAAQMAYTLIEELEGAEKRKEIEEDTLYNYIK